MFHRVAFHERTRGPVEMHMGRPTPFFLADLLALDAIDALEQRQAKADTKVGKR